MEDLIIKKITALLLIAVMAVTFMTGCGTDPILDDLSNYLNVEMAEINANHTAIGEHDAKMRTLEDDEALAVYIEENILPLVYDSIQKLESVNPSTEEVLVLKEVYSAMMGAYKGGYEALCAGCITQDDEVIASAVELLEAAAETLDIYNQEVEALVSEHGGEVEY